MPVLSLVGFSSKPEGDSIVLQKCPFADVAASGPGVVCEIHRGLIDAALGVKANLIARDPYEALCEIRLAS